MSKTLLTRLPRFDEKGGLLPPTDWLRSFDDADPGLVLDTIDIAPIDTFDPPAPVVEVPIEQPSHLDLKKVEASLTALNGKLDKIERDAQAQIVEAVQSIAAKLFPLLSKAFLAEEIGRHLPSLVPASAAVVEIRAEASLAAELQVMMERHASLADRCTLVPATAPGQGRVDVSWQTGGLSFDFDGLLQACLSNLKSTQTVTKE
ncbi:MAG: hypothetical protein ACK4N1_01485 [Pseudorhizobium sp.]